MKSNKLTLSLSNIAKIIVFASAVTVILPMGYAQEDEDIVTLQQYEVRGFRDSLLLARQEARNSLSLKDVIAADAVGKLPDSNIAEALKRVTSIYLVPDQGEGRYVSIRGADPILNNVTLNGQTIAVSDTDGRSGRAAPLDVLSASSISRIEVFKVTTPDMDGQSIGGTINILTPSAFDFPGAFSMFNAEYGYNDFATESDIYSFQFNWADRFGDNEEWGLFIGANYWYREYLSIMYENSDIGNPENGAGFDNELVPSRVVFGSAIGERERYGMTANLEYSPDEDTFVWFRTFFTEYNDEEVRPEFTIRNRGDIGSSSLTETYFTRYRLENETRYEIQERPVRQFVFGGQQQISDSWSIEGNLNFTNAKELNPLLNYNEAKDTTSSRGDIDDVAALNPVLFWVSPEGFASPTYNTSFTGGLHPSQPELQRISRLRTITSIVEEDTVTVDFDALWEGDWNGKSTTFKTGFKWLNRDKFVDDTDLRFPYRGYDTLADAGLGRTLLDYNQGIPYTFADTAGTVWIVDHLAMLAHKAANPGDYDFDERGSTSNSIEDDYTMEEEVFAYYAMASIELTPDVILTGGVRVEKTDVTVSAFSFVDRIRTDHPPEISKIDELPFEESEAIFIADNNEYTNVLPSVNLKWIIDSNLQFRASITTNLGRPDYPDSSPISELRIQEDEYEPGVFSASNEIGNPDLQPYESTNYDISLDYYFAENSGVFSIGGFYKRIENAIYQFNQEFDNFEFLGVVFDQYNEETLSNADPGHISGIEFNYQQDLIMLPEPFDGFGILANIALMDSEVTVPERPGEKFPFFNQADTVYNLQVYYERNGFEARLAYTYQSEAIFDELEGEAQEDLYRDELSSLDAKISYQIDDSWQIYLTMKNLTDELLRTYHNGVGRRLIGENPGFERYGTEFRIGATWSK
ncbi:MAG: TonB-dependent receptor [Verrucomicrobia bacterium]|nr:TonB-dependent receptor [Verrucomicrobiota bacterium]